MSNAWSMSNGFATSYGTLHGANLRGTQDLSRLADNTRFKTRGDSLIRTNKENNFNDYLTVSAISYQNPNSKNRPFCLLDKTQSGFTKNNLNNDGKTYYNGRVVDKKDLRLTEYTNKYRPFK